MKRSLVFDFQGKPLDRKIFSLVEWCRCGSVGDGFAQSAGSLFRGCNFSRICIKRLLVDKISTATPKSDRSILHLVSPCFLNRLTCNNLYFWAVVEEV